MEARNTPNAQESLPQKAEAFVSWLENNSFMDPGDQSRGIMVRDLGLKDFANPLVMNRLHRIDDKSRASAVLKLVGFMSDTQVVVFDRYEKVGERELKEGKKRVSNEVWGQKEMALSVAELKQVSTTQDLEKLQERLMGWRINRVEELGKSKFWLGEGLEELGKIEGVFPEELREVADVLAAQGMLLLVVGGVPRSQLGAATQVNRDKFGNHDADAIVVGAQNIDEVKALIQDLDAVELAEDQSNQDKYQQVRLKIWGRSVDITLARREQHSVDGVEIVVAVDGGNRITAAIDLERRGFTIDGVLVDANEVVYGIQGAFRDIEHKVLTMIDPKSFVRDPRRLVRGIGYMLQGYRFSKDNVAVLHGMVDVGALSEYVGTYGKKIGKLLEQLSKAPDPFKALLQLDKIGVVGKYLLGDISLRLDWTMVEGLRMRNSRSDEFTVTGVDMELAAMRLEQPSESVLRFVVAHMVEADSARKWLLNDSGWRLPNGWDGFTLDTFVQRNQQRWKEDEDARPRQWQDWVGLVQEYQDLYKQMPKYSGNEVDEKTLREGGLLLLKRKAWLALLDAK